MSEREWMYHSLVLCRERVSDFKAQHEAVDEPLRLFQRLKWELEWREHCWKMVNAGRERELSVVGRVWLGYMRGHAQLQVARADRRIDEAVFHIKAGLLRKQREFDLRMIRERVA